MPVSTRKDAEQVQSAAQLLDIIVLPAAFFLQGEVPLAVIPRQVGGQADPVAEAEIQPAVGLPGAEGTGAEPDAACDRTRAEDRPRREEGNAVLGIVDHRRTEILDAEHAQVILSGLDIADPDPVDVDGGMGAAQAAEADGFQTGAEAIVSDIQAGDLHQRAGGVIQR